MQALNTVSGSLKDIVDSQQNHSALVRLAVLFILSAATPP